VLDQQDLLNRKILVTGLSPHHHYKRDQVPQEVTLIIVVMIIPMTMITKNL
jgi:hypothetical protein